MNRLWPMIKQIIFYGIVGLGSLLIDLGVTTALYDFAHFPAYLAGVIGFVSAFFFNFPINRKHVFNHTKEDKFNMKIQIILYAALSLFNLLMTGILINLLVNSAHIQISIAKICITALIAIWNFILFKFVIFAKHEAIPSVIL